MATLFSARFFLSLGRRVQSKSKRLFRQIFPWINFLIEHVLISTFNPQEVLKKWTGRHITEERAKNTKKWPILYLHKSLASFLTKNLSMSFLWFTLFWEPHTPTAYWASSNTDSNTLTYTQNAKGFPPSGLMNHLQSNWYSTIKTTRCYLLRIIC